MNGVGGASFPISYDGRNEEHTTKGASSKPKDYRDSRMVELCFGTGLHMCVASATLEGAPANPTSSNS